MMTREVARLRRIFSPLLVLTMAAPAACSGGSDGPSDDAGAQTNADAHADSTVPGDDDDTGAPSADAQGARDGGADGTIDGGGGPSCDAAPELIPDVYEDTAATDGEICDFFEKLPCGLPTGITPVDCLLYTKDCNTLLTQDAAFYNCHVVECDDAGIWPDATSLSVEYITCSGAIGRRPCGLAPASFAPASTEVGDWLARVAHLEAASVHAFRALGAELAHHDAPRSLLDAASRSVDDERRHTRITSRLARRFGARTVRPRVRRAKVRSLEAIAIENAIEGCVRETYGALVAAWQATHAEDEAIARAMAEIAEDELRHAALAWSVAAWLDAQLDDAARARVTAARNGAIAALKCEASASASESLVAVAGLPNASESRRLVEGLARDLWG